MFPVVNCKPIRGQFVSYWPIRGHFDVIASHKSAAVTKSCNYRHFQVLFWARTIWCPVHCNNCTTHRPPPTQKFLILNIFKTNIWTFCNLVHVNYFDTKRVIQQQNLHSRYFVMYFLFWDTIIQYVKHCTAKNKGVSCQHSSAQFDTNRQYFLVRIFGLGFVRNTTGSVIIDKPSDVRICLSFILLKLKSKMPLKTTVIGAWPKEVMRDWQGWNFILKYWLFQCEMIKSAMFPFQFFIF